MQQKGLQRCTRCGTEAPASARFCGYCGEVLIPPSERLELEGPPPPAPEEEPIFLPTSARSYQVVGGGMFTPPKTPKTPEQGLDWLEEAMQGQPASRKTRPVSYSPEELLSEQPASRKTRPVSYSPEELISEQTAPLGPRPTPPAPPRSQEPLSPPPARVQSEAPPLPSPVHKTPPASPGAAPSVSATWLSTVVADLAEYPELQENPRAWRKRTLMLLALSVVLVLVVAAIVLIRAHGL